MIEVCVRKLWHIMRCLEIEGWGTQEL